MVEIADIAVNPRTGAAFAAVSADGAPAIVQIDGVGKVTVLSLENVSFSSVTLADAPEDKVVGKAGVLRTAARNRLRILLF